MSEDAVSFRHYLHQHPELSDQEVATTAYLTAHLAAWGYRITTPKTLHTGVIAEIGPDTGVVVGLRSDIDALPITERTGLSFASVNPGVMHACGHDFHMASLLGAAQQLATHPEQLAGTIRLIFQPAEETHVGAQEVVTAGGIDGLNAIIGFHEKPDLGVATVGLRQGGLMAAVDQFKVTFHGVGTHAAMPQLGADPIVGLSATVTALQSVVSRNVDPQQTAVLSVTHIQGGATWNVIPEAAWFEGTVRTFSQTARQVIKQRFYDVVNSQAATFGLKATIDWIEGPDVVDNDPQLTQIVTEASRQFLTVVDPLPSNAGEDFAYFSHRVPSVFAFFGSHGTSDWHHDDLVLDDAALPAAVDWYVRIGQRLLTYFAKEATHG